MLVMVVFFIAFRWIHLSTPLIRLFLLVLILLLMPTLNFLPVWFRSEERFSRNAETDLVCRLLLEKKKKNSFNNVMDRRKRASQVGRGGVSDAQIHLKAVDAAQF